MKSIYETIKDTWTIPPAQKDLLDRHFILHWSPSYLFAHHGKAGLITKDAIQYIRIYHLTSPAQLAKARVALLSFRRIRGMSIGYVLITAARDKSLYAKDEPKDTNV